MVEYMVGQIVTVEQNGVAFDGLINDIFDSCDGENLELILEDGEETYVPVCDVVRILND